MKTNLIRTIYLYVFSGVGLALFLIGIFKGIYYSVNITQFDKYPLQQYEEIQCGYPYSYPGKPALVAEEMRAATPSAEQTKEQEQKCNERQEDQRARKRLEDLTQTLAFTIIGIMVFIPHWRMARKAS